MKKEIIQLDNLSLYTGCTNYINQLLLPINEVLSVKVDAKQGGIKIYYYGERNREKFIRVPARKGYPERGKSNCIQKGKALINTTIGTFI